uniref:HTH_Tnp_Tc3_1 domain-containing protein n=1 Tax=Caenorhabditis japonica TaxID=281687 RepID=A0A8R1IUF1_CAEJA
MGRGKPLTDYEQGLIDDNSALGMSNQLTAVFIGRSLNVVNNYIKNPRHYGTKKPPGPPSLLSDRDKRNIVRKASNALAFCVETYTITSLSCRTELLFTELVTQRDGWRTVGSTSWTDRAYLRI